jgi:predicted TIM-barrel fold metal-dependent hydrolase
MIIDVHTHIMTVWEREPFTENDLLQRMDQLHIDKFVLLPIGVTPDTPYFYYGTEDVLATYSRHPDRVIPFCMIDPRMGKNSPETDFSWILSRYAEAGCKGVGEFTPSLYINDPKCLNFYRQCAPFSLPIIFHLSHQLHGTYGVVDDAGLPRLEECLQSCPETTFIIHGPSFWAEIGAGVKDEERGGYPKGPITAPGRTVELLQQYPNLYGDLSAGSGFNAIARDKEFGISFLEECSDKLLFGTDLCHKNQDVPIVPFFEELKESRAISEKAWTAITEGNAIRLFNL